MVLLWLQAGPPADTDADIGTILEGDPPLARWDDAARRSLFRLWNARGGRTRLLDALRRTPEWDAAGWPFLAGDAASQKDFQAGCAIIFKHLACPAAPAAANDGPQSGQPDDTGLLRSRFDDRPTAASAEALARGYYRDQDFDAVLRLAGEAGAGNAASAALSALAYHAAVRQGHWDAAWQWAVQYVRQTDSFAVPE